MTTENTNLVQVEAWVSGTSLEDERVRGFVESISPDGQIAKVFAVESDHPEAVGHTVLCRVNRLEGLPIDARLDVDTALQLVDLALDAGDRSWFEELSAELHALGASSDSNSGHSQGGRQPHKRIRV